MWLQWNVHLLKVTDAVVLMDREQGGVEMLASQGIKLHPIISMFKLLNVLLAAERIDAQTAQSVRKFILDNNTFRYTTKGEVMLLVCLCVLMQTLCLTCATFSPKEENGNDVPATKKPCVQQDVELSYSDRAKLPSK